MNTFNPDIKHIFKESLNQKSNKPFLVTGKRTLTYGDLKSQIGKISTYLANSGILAGDRILLSSKNEEFICYFYLTLLANGITVIFIDADSGHERAKSIIEFCNPTCIFVDEYLIEKWQLKPVFEEKVIPLVFENNKKILGNFLGRDIEKSTKFPASIEELPESMSLAEIDLNSDAYILFTSGTTSAPKGVRISYRALFSHLHTLVKVYELNERSRIFNNLILSHADGMVQGPLLAFFSKSVVYRSFPFSINQIEDIFDIIYQEKISHWIVVPTMISIINQLKGKDKDTLETKEFKYIISCGGKLESKLWEGFESKFKTRIINGYGLTETVAGGLFAGPDDKSHVIGTIGIPVDCEARIVDGNGKDLPEGETGEIWMRGTLLMSGYLNAPELNEEIFSDGWLKTGDLAYKGKDQCFRIVGRKKSVIIIGGFNINPEEITEVLNTHNDVYEAITFGVDDETWGEIALSAVVLKPGINLLEEELTRYCRNYLEERKIPAHIYVLKELPHGRSGKVNLPELKEIVSNLTSKNLKNQEFKPVFYEIVSKCLQLPIEEIIMDISTENCPAWDSMSHLLMIAEFEKHFEIEFSPLEVMDVAVLSDLYNALIKKLKN